MVADLVVIAGVIVFFAICAWYVAGLDRLVGPDHDVSTEDGTAMSKATR